MSKWRPKKLNCKYVIADIHGHYENLRLILKRILPLRKSDGGKDKLVFLGDYVDRNENSHKVIDLLIEVKEQFPNQVIFLKGNHEELFLDAIFYQETSECYLEWMKNGGYYTLLGYSDRKGYRQENPYLITHKRVRDFIPKEHVKFLESLELYHEDEDYIYVHAGCDPLVPLDQQNSYDLLWNRSLFKMCRTWNKKFEVPWDKTIVTGHSCFGNDPFVSPKFLMLDVSIAKSLMVVELDSRKGMLAKDGNARLIQVDLCQF